MLGSDEMNNYNYEYMNYSSRIPNGRSDISLNSETRYPSNIVNEDRVNYMPNMDDYKIQFLNQSPFAKQAISKQISDVTSNMGGNMNQTNSILEPYPGFMRGNMFANLYEGYKNYRPQEINSSNERENLLNQWQEYDFALIDLDLYLDTHPNDSKAIQLYNNYLKMKEQICKKYESMYGPLTLNSSDFNQNNWVWIRSPWPWEEM